MGFVPTHAGWRWVGSTTNKFAVFQKRLEERLWGSMHADDCVVQQRYGWRCECMYVCKQAGKTRLRSRCRSSRLQPSRVQTSSQE